MADNSTMGGSTDVIRDKDRAGVKTEIVGIDVAIGTGTEALLSTTNPMPVIGNGTAGTPGTAVLTIQGIAAGTPVIAKPTAAATGTITAPALSLSSFTILASNANRLGACVYNDSSITVYLALATTASTTSYTIQLPPTGFYELPTSGTIFTGLISGIALTASGNLRVTELT